MIYLKHKAIILFIVLFFSILLSQAQQIQVTISDIKSSFRGLSAVNDSLVWVSGSSGTFGKTINGGASWIWNKIKGFEKTNFRDIEAFDENTAIVMGIDSPGIILKTKDGGTNWQLVYKDTTSGIFLDAMDFFDINNGIVVGDPLKSRFYILKTDDGGNHFEKIAIDTSPIAEEGEACFASSGTNIRMLNNKDWVLVSGGKSSNLISSKNKINIPILQGKESTGANSIAIKNKKCFMIVGGDFNQKDSKEKNIAITKNGGKSWQVITTPPNGYRSCVEYLGKKRWITCGLNGIDISKDNGQTFESIGQQSFHVCRKAKNGKAVYFAGNSIIGKMIYDK